MFRLLQVALGAAVMSLGSSLLAAEIRWFGDESCRRELELTAQVESMTGRPVSTVELADFELRVKSLSPDQWQLELSTVRRGDGGRSTRAIRGATCADVTDAAAVAIALAIGPSTAAGESENAAQSPSNQHPVAALETPARAAGKLPATHSSLEWFAGLGGVLDSSATPSLTLGASLHVGLSGQPSSKSATRLRFELEGALYAPTETSSVAGQAGKFKLRYLAPLVCAVTPRSETTLLACAGYELGQLSGEGVGDAVSASHPSTTFWSAARAELGLLVPLASTLRLAGRAGVAVPLIRREFVLDGPDVVFRAAPISARAELGVELSL